uniref:Formylglycine-generating enzyme, required for sulfatase activity, contains SUMF1/FGE domain n=1 Tax=Candidatus Kentrum sp. LFY TaxID=2126342 RepID=A0A450WR53_9GAMM|nr:MAG: Formylglycine-generating enzyme, required for sulfatase activity, contains SUMF1/FGE domain [Candidatus Kentron sp. LFY]
MEKKQKNPKEGKRTIKHRGEIFTIDGIQSDGGSSNGSEADTILDKAAYKRNLHHYEITFSRALQKAYPEIDRAVREQLQRRSQALGLSAEDVARIEEQVTVKAVAYRANLQQYRLIFRKVIRDRYPVDDQERYKLKQQQRILGLLEADVATIENEVTNEKVAARIEQRQRSLRRGSEVAAGPRGKNQSRKTGDSEHNKATITTSVGPGWFLAGKVVGIVVLLLAVGVATYLLVQREPDYSSWSVASSEKEPSHTKPQLGKSSQPDEPGGRLVIRSNVLEDSVYINGHWVGSTSPKPYSLTAGKHNIRVEKSGYEPFETRITVAPDGKEIIYVRLIAEVPPPGQTFQDKLKDGSLGPRMVVVPPGKFLMGSSTDEAMRYDGEGPQHPVRIARSFAIGVTTVTFRDYDSFAKATGRKLPDDEGWGRGKRPVMNVSWYEANAYAKWLTKQTGKQYRLPTEAEWEYAARAGTTTPFSTGECIHTNQANYKGNYDYADCGARTGVAQGKTLPTGSMPANLWGLHEIHGNVWEWTNDCWHYHYHDAPADGSTWGEEGNGYCSERVVRGGSWRSGPRDIRSAVRSSDWVDIVSTDLGFRLVRGLEP